MSAKYPKLVRDNIPDIIKAQGEIPLVRKVDFLEKRKFLLKKLYEELEEAENNGSDRELLSELADLQDVLDALTNNILQGLGLTEIHFEEMRTKKTNRNGGFTEGFVIDGIQGRPLNIYFGHALTNATEEYRQDRETARCLLEKEEGIFVHRFIGLTKGGCGDVFDCDIIQCVGGADLFVCDLSFDSNGTGIEFCEAVRMCGIPALALFERNARVSRLILGFEERLPNLVTVERYDNIIDDLVPLVLDKISKTPVLSNKFRK